MKIKLPIEHEFNGQCHIASHNDRITLSWLYYPQTLGKGNELVVSLTWKEAEKIAAFVSMKASG